MQTFQWAPGREQTINVGGFSLEIRCFGPAPDNAPTLILLHEGLGCVALWRDFPEQLAEHTGCGVLVYSRAGYGTSDPAVLPRPLDYMTREATECLPHLISDTQINKAILLGHSDGASIAAIYAGTQQDHSLCGIILIAPHFFTEPEGLASIEQAKIAFEETDLREKLSKYHKDADNAFRGWNDAWLDPDFECWDITDVIDYIRVPILAIQGEDDQYGTLAQLNVVSVRSYAPVDQLVLSGCQHAPHLEAPEPVLKSVTEFVQRLKKINGL